LLAAVQHSDSTNKLLADYHRDALLKHQRQDLEAARVVYHKILQLDPRNSRALHMLGLIVMVADKQQEIALAMLEKSVRIFMEADVKKKNKLFYYNDFFIYYCYYLFYFVRLLLI
jgi:hypothetical protein